MAQPQITAKKQQELQQQYTNYKNNLQQLAQRIGDIEQDTEEHKYADISPLSVPLEICQEPISNSPPKISLRARPLIRSYRLVLETLGPLPPDRKCFRMINGVLVERTVKDVTPALQTNSEGLQKVLEELVKQYKKQQEDMEKWKVKFSEMREDHLLTVFRNAEEEQHTGRPAIGDCQAVAYCGYTLLIHLISNTTSTEHIKQGECNDRLVLRHAWTLDETMLSLHKLCGSLAMQDAFMPDIIVDQKLFLYRQLVII